MKVFRIHSIKLLEFWFMLRQFSGNKSYGACWLDCTDVPSIFFFFSTYAWTNKPQNVFLTWAHICNWSVKLCSQRIFIPNVALTYRTLSWTSLRYIVYDISVRYVAYDMSRTICRGQCERGLIPSSTSSCIDACLYPSLHTIHKFIKALLAQIAPPLNGDSAYIFQSGSSRPQTALFNR